MSLRRGLMRQWHRSMAVPDGPIALRHRSSARPHRSIGERRRSIGERNRSMARRNRSMARLELAALA
jgi:hypothetical protein